MNRVMSGRAVAAATMLLLAGCDAKIVDPEDRVPPTVEITSPSDQEVVSGMSFVVTADAADNQGIERVQFQIADFEPIPVETPPYRTRLVTFGRQEGSSFLVTVTAFDVSGNTASDFVAIEIGTRTITRITTNVGPDLNPTWSPDGTLLAYQSIEAEVTGTYDIWMIGADGTNPTQLTSDVQDDRNPAWSPDGAWIAFDSNRQLNYEIFKLPLAGGEPQLEQLTFANNDDVEPAWSPDGLTVFFASNRGDNAPFNIWTVPASGDSSLTLQLTSFDADERDPSASPDGDFLAFTSTLNVATPHVYLMELGVQQVVLLTGDVGQSESNPSWSTGGNVVTFTRSIGALPGKVWLQERLGTGVLQCTFGTGPVTGDGGAVWSPDGTRIAFHSDRDGNPDLYVIE